MNNHIIFSVFAFFVLTIAAVLIHRRLVHELHAKLKLFLEQNQEAERQIHIKAMEYLSEKNKIEIAHLEALNQARLLSFNEGRKQGKAEHQLEAATQIADQRNEFSIRLQYEKEQAAIEAAEKQRAENELQAKLFSIKISPYLQLLTDKGLINDTYEPKSGYQYQLLINGIPAFQPHVVIERQEKIKKIDQAVKSNFLSLARTCAEAAVTTYLGASPQFAKLAPDVIEEIEKK